MAECGMKHSGESEGACYTVGELAKLAGVSARALRHYEDVGLLHPMRSESNYRMFGERDARRLAQILAMRACGLSLADIKRMFDDPNVDLHAALSEHLTALRKQELLLEQSIARTRQAMDALERMESMTTHDAFAALKEKAIAENERAYGREARERYGEEAVDAANDRLRGLSEEEWNSLEELEEAIKAQLRRALATGDPFGEEARMLARMHARWIALHWGEGAYSREAHLGLAQGYMADERFVAYYDGAAGEGATEFLVLALEAHL